MPQMAPLYWEILFFVFIACLVVVSMIIYHLPNIYMVTSINNKINSNQINWKW
uniref:ATP synthase complex subunit 8 n=1 Tax=Diolcus irroratus TaxID=2080391 RepID=A0A2P1CLR8_9HEMI|nr:ATP synthase F0 subunit 8 [Diolcus irroratus]